jgi:hypothetical protein
VALGYTGGHIRGTEVNYKLRSTQHHNRFGGTRLNSQAVSQLFQTRHASDTSLDKHLSGTDEDWYHGYHANWTQIE